MNEFAEKTQVAMHVKYLSKHRKIESRMMTSKPANGKMDTRNHEHSTGNEKRKETKRQHDK